MRLDKMRVTGACFGGSAAKASTRHPKKNIKASHSGCNEVKRGILK
jgi:hypothetical protein